MNEDQNIGGINPGGAMVTKGIDWINNAIARIKLPEVKTNVTASVSNKTWWIVGGILFAFLVLNKKIKF